MLPNLKAKLIEDVFTKRDKYLTKDAHDTKEGGEVVQAIAATIGFVSEANHCRKVKKSKRDAAKIEEAAAVVGNPPSETTEGRAAELPPAPTDLAAAFLHRHSQSKSAPRNPSSALASSVLIPQRRPNRRAQGFAPAYAPTLSTMGISQDTFLNFVTTLNESLKPSPYLNAINLASFAGEASPEPLIGLLIGEAVEKVTTAIMEVQSRMRSNEFLDEVNEDFFAPRGLFAFIGTWRPNGDATERAVTSRADEVAIPSQPQANVLDIPMITVGFKTATTKGGWTDFGNQVRRAMLPAGGDFAAIVPETLAWPSAEEITAASRSSRIKKMSRIHRAGVWVDEYVDKQSQVPWTQESPGLPLAGSLPKPDFRSRYAVPSHAASCGDVVSLLTGGRWHVKEDENKARKNAGKQPEKGEEERGGAEVTSTKTRLQRKSVENEK
jgi:hypothetical protein